MRLPAPFSKVACVIAFAGTLKGGFEPLGIKLEEFAQQVKTDLARWNKVVK